jgi:uracil-DNA glycosylase
MSDITPKIEENWKKVLIKEFSKEYFFELKNFLIKEKKDHVICPKGQDIFNAFNLTSFNNVKVVILGQDPYHGEGQAHGLSFSVPNHIKQPPSLKNIFKELSQDINIPIPRTGNLTCWAKQGVLLLNSILTVRLKEAGSHQKKGWEIFTDTVIHKLSKERTGIVFMLWGRYAQEKAKIIDNNKHLILTAPHPSPFSAYTGFFGCNHFSKTNNFLKENGKNEIDWKII